MLIAICKSMQIIKKKKLLCLQTEKKKEVLNLLDKGND